MLSIPFDELIVALTETEAELLPIYVKILINQRVYLT
jgi:hypothetical protein